MFKLSMRCLAVTIAVALMATMSRTAEPKVEGGDAGQLVGTWKLVTAKYNGNAFQFPEGVTTIKHVTPEQFTWMSYGKDGQLTRAAGGGYTVKGEVYEETPEYGLGAELPLLKGKAQTFTWKVQGNQWLHKGQLSDGLTIDEVWERVGKK